MAKSNKIECDYCAGTGIVKAAVVHNEIDGVLYKTGINVVLCKDHFDLGETTMETMESATTLPLNVVGVNEITTV